jgi:hypothetical protein
MPLSNLIRWGGLVAAIAAALFIIADLVVVVIALGQGSAEGLLFRAAISGSAGVLLALGLVGLYARQAEPAGYLGLVGFLAAFIALWLGQENVLWAALLANVGWALFGVASLGAGIYPRVATILLIVGAVLAGVVNLLLLAIDFAGTAPASLVGVGGLVGIIFNAGIVWLGISLFTGRTEEARQPTRSRRTDSPPPR